MRIIGISITAIALALAGCANKKGIDPYGSYKQEAILLYPDTIPNSKPTPAGYIEKTNESGTITKVTVPTVTPYLPEKSKSNGTAVIVCPGGGYIGVSVQNAAEDVAREFNKIGVTAFVLKYRLPNDGVMIDKTIGPLQDAQRAIQLVRERAVEWGIDSSKVGIIGFSAGGHLASTVATHFSTAVISNNTNTNLRPDFTILVYPVITMEPAGNNQCAERLLGKHPSPEMVELFSNDKQVTFDTPPTFLVHAIDDPVALVQNSTQYYDALIKHNVKAQIYLYQQGGHGFGLKNSKTRDWFQKVKSWMGANGWL
ncbi:MAG: alpha/beta hydrolase [Sphingobacteriales bacterium]|nr:MAG: alpha/beta hydrolase [Sphingobacteriales bacterium]